MALSLLPDAQTQPPTQPVPQAKIGAPRTPGPQTPAAQGVVQPQVKAAETSPTAPTANATNNCLKDSSVATPSSSDPTANGQQAQPNTPAKSVYTDLGKAGCLVTGMLVIPFKYELAKGRDVFAGVTLAGMVGWNPPIQYAPTLIAFAGLGVNLNSGSSSASAGSTNSSASTPSISYGVGIAFPLGGSIQTPLSQSQNVSRAHIGFVLGVDHQTSDLHYKHNDKPWLSIFIGSSF